MKNSRGGFTLIELMVVISIIALFASIAFATLTSVRARAQQAAIQSDLKSIKSQAELSYNNTGDYSAAGSAVSAIIAGINKSGGTASFYTLDNTHFAVSARLNSDPTKNWSVSDQANNVVWDNENSSSTQMSWDNATAACTNTGKRLPTIEELKALYDAGGIMTNYSSYWSGTESNYGGTPATFAYAVNTWTGYVSNSVPKSTTYLFRCVQ